MTRVEIKRVVSNHVRSASVRYLGVIVGAVLVLPACSFDDPDEGLDEDVGQEQQEIVAANGMSLNGVSLNGISLNGMNLNGMNLNGMSLNGMNLNGTSLNGTSLNGMNLNGMNLNGMNLNGMNLNGSQLNGSTSGGQPISGAQLVGARLNGAISDGRALPLRITAAETLASPNSDVWAYAVEYFTDAGWTPLCGTQQGTAVLAIPLTGTWNYRSGVPGGGSWTASDSSFTFGCRGTALAKCVEFGYKPWAMAGGALLRDHHQACTRMLRADYCGNGKSWTRDGTPINIYDDVGIQADEATWRVDAEWTADGAICTNHIRDFQRGRPGCVRELRDPQCGQFYGGALLIDEFGETRASAARTSSDQKWTPTPAFKP